MGRARDATFRLQAAKRFAEMLVADPQGAPKGAVERRTTLGQIRKDALE